MQFQSKKYKVSFRGRTGLTYSEEKKTITIDSELFFDPAGVTVYCDSINHWDNPNKETVTLEEKKKIINNIKNELEKKGYRVDLA